MAKLFWTQKQDIGPSARNRFAMAYDAARQRVVLFGGLPETGQLSNDTWAWNGEFWTQMADIGPTARSSPALGYEADRERIVLQGGFGPALSGHFADTWEWDGEEWTQMADTGPAPREGSAVTFDNKRKRILLFGGLGANHTSFSDTWTWDGNDWTQEQDTGPDGRYDHKLAYDTVRDRIVLFGGAYLVGHTVYHTGSPFSSGYDTTDYTYTALSDTWEWDGKKWTRVCDTGPGPRGGYGMAYNDESVLLFGGYDGGKVFGDTWEWDGKHWTQIQDIGPSLRTELGVAYDTNRKRTVLFGGVQLNPVTKFGDTWELFIPTQKNPS